MVGLLLGMVPARTVDETGFFIPVVMSYPIAKVETRSFFVTPFWGEVEGHITGDDLFVAACECRVGVKDIAILILVEYAKTGSFFSAL